MTVLAEYNHKTAVEMQVFFRFLFNELGTVYNNIARKFKNPNAS